MGPSRIRLTYATAMVLQALDEGYRYGFDIIDATGLRSGTVYPVAATPRAVGRRQLQVGRRRSGPHRQPAALTISSTISTRLYGVGRADPLIFLLVPTVLPSVVLVACLPPALRASRVDPMRALETD